MSRREREFRIALVKLSIFCVVSVIVTGGLAMIMGRLGASDKVEYNAMFTSASQLEKGDDVRVAGVSVGDVSDVEVTDSGRARVTFRVERTLPMTTQTKLEVRYLNLVGARYLAVSEGTPGGSPLGVGGTLPVSQTTPAINLTELFNGFQPLFQALSPEDVNQLASNLIGVFQGEGGTIKTLLNQVGSLTSTLANRDQLISSVITNLTTTLETVDGKHTELAELLTRLNKWMSDLADDKHVIGNSVGDIADMADELAGLLVRLRPHAKADIAEMQRILTIFNRPGNQAFVDETLQRLPTTLRRQARIGSHGSWYNYYLCDFDAKIVLPSLGPAFDNLPVIKQVEEALADIAIYSKAERCNP